MKRRLLFTLVVGGVFGTACQSAGRKGPATPAALPSPLGDYVGELRLVQHPDGEQKIEVTAGSRPGGTCELAVRVRQVTFEKETARFSLDTVGLPSVKGQAAQCRRAQAGLLLSIEGLAEGADPETTRGHVDGVLWTPEAYLKTKGIDFDRPEAGAPKRIASKLASAGSTEQSLGRQVSAWPRVLLSVDPWYYDGSGRIRQEGQVELDAVVGTDGRIYDPNVRTGLGGSHERAVLHALALWRFEPAMQGDEAVGARISLQPVLKIY